MLIITTSFYFSTLTPLGPGTLSKAVFDILYAQLVGKTERQWWRQEARGERREERGRVEGENIRERRIERERNGTNESDGKWVVK